MKIQKVLENFGEKVISMGKGSIEYQVTSITKSIAELSKHLKTNKKDFSCKYGLVKKVSLRNKLLKYLKAESLPRYHSVLSILGLRK